MHRNNMNVQCLTYICTLGSGHFFFHKWGSLYHLPINIMTNWFIILGAQVIVIIPVRKHLKSVYAEQISALKDLMKRCEHQIAVMKSL